MNTQPMPANSTKAIKEHHCRPVCTRGTFEFTAATRRKIVDGIPFRSTLEANTYQLLKSWESASAIRNLKLQPRFVLQDEVQARRQYGEGHALLARLPV